MKFQVDLYRHQTRRVEVFAENRDEAMKLALRTNEGFRSDGLVELRDEDEPGAESTLEARCEACDGFIWEGDEYVSTFEDGNFCAKCAPQPEPPQ